MKPLVISHWDKESQSWVRDIGLRAEGPDVDNQDALSILSKVVNIESFTGKDGYVIVYDETADEFHLEVLPADAQNAISILSKPVTVDDFTGKDGCILAYDETAGEFYLKADDAGGGGLEVLADSAAEYGSNFISTLNTTSYAYPA